MAVSFFSTLRREKVLVDREKIESLSFTYTANGKSQFQVENFSK